jgi:hypothetical protein
MRIILFFVVSIAFLLQAGCGEDASRPKDLPKLYSVNISITQESKPLEGAIVTLSSTTPSTYGMASGTTNASGTATLRTYGYPGVPLGEYKVLVQKVGVEGAKEDKTPEGKPIRVGGKSYQYVDAQYGTESSTAFSISVTEKGVKATFEVGAPVKIFRGNVGE